MPDVNLYHQNRKQILFRGFGPYSSQLPVLVPVTSTYAVNKRRAWQAPEGSGVPVGTEYHWYILADQNVRKLDANSYTTSMTGLKYKLAHKRAEKERWSATDDAQRNQLIQILEELINELKKQRE
jgi:hypothetical protein